MIPENRKALACTALLLLPLLACGGEEFVRPNLVMISVDGLRPSQLSCYDGPADLGAEVCELGESGVRYVWAFTTASSGGPAAASLLTAQYPRQHGVRNGSADFLRSQAGSLAEALRAGGYATGAFVGSPELNRSRNFQQGFGVFDDRAASASNALPETALTDAALAWVEQTSRPFFLWIHFAEPHGPFTNTETGAPTNAHRNPQLHANDAEHPRRGQRESDLHRARYETAIRRLDRRLSQLIAVLDASGSVPGILLVGLHGQSLNEPRTTVGHGASLRLDEIRIPLLWRPPRAAPGQNVARRVTTPVSLIDVAPTLLDAAGLRWPPSFQGLGLPYSRGAASDLSDRAIFAEHPNEVAVISAGEYARARRPAPPPIPAADTEAALEGAEAEQDVATEPVAAGPSSTALAGEPESDAAGASADAGIEGDAARPPDRAATLPDLTADLRPDRERGDEALPAYDRPGSAPERAERLGKLISDFIASAPPPSR